MRRAKPNHSAAQTDGGSSGGGWVWEEEVWLCQHLWVRIYLQENGNPACRYENMWRFNVCAANKNSYMNHCGKARMGWKSNWDPLIAQGFCSCFLKGKEQLKQEVCCGVTLSHWDGAAGILRLWEAGGGFIPNISLISWSGLRSEQPAVSGVGVGGEVGGVEVCACNSPHKNQG